MLWRPLALRASRQHNVICSSTVPPGSSHGGLSNMAHNELLEVDYVRHIGCYEYWWGRNSKAMILGDSDQWRTVDEFVICITKRRRKVCLFLLINQLSCNCQATGLNIFVLHKAICMFKFIIAVQSLVFLSNVYNQLTFSNTFRQIIRSVIWNEMLADMAKMTEKHTCFSGVFSKWGSSFSAGNPAFHIIRGQSNTFGVNLISIHLCEPINGIIWECTSITSGLLLHRVVLLGNNYTNT